MCSSPASRCSSSNFEIGSNQYTSKDLTILPCESKANEFFFPLEFDDAGNQVYADQAPAIEKALHHAQRVYVFIHGWNKTPDLAERDYQDLICRFYTHSKRDEASAKRSIIIGVFWPSSDFPPLLNFWRMKNRSDDLAITGFQSLIRLLANPTIESGGHYDLVLIGHSFGGRIILKGVAHYINQLTPERHRFLSNLNQLQLVLLTTAMGKYALLPRFGLIETESLLDYKHEWDSDAFLQKMENQYGRKFTHKELLIDVRHLHLQWHPSLVELSGLTDFRIYNIFSTHDDANRFLYPMGSLMERGQPACAIGACGVPHWPNLVSATSAGSLESVIDLSQSNLWNIDASRIILSHTDIYKGRISSLMWELISLPRPQFSEIKVLGISGNSDIYEMMAQHDQYAMRKINEFRQLGEAGLKSVNELSALAFGLDEELRKEDWVAAEKGIREITKLKYFYPGWFLQFDAGLIEKVLIFNSSTVRAEWTPLNEVSIHLLLAHVLAKQGKCDEAGQEARMGIAGVTDLQTFTEGYLTSWISLRNFLWNFPGDDFQPDRIRMLNCQRASE